MTTKNEIEVPHQAFYIQSMLFNSTSAMRSVEHLNALMAAVMRNSPENPFGALPVSRYLSELQNLLVHAAALSRYFWPVRGKHEWRGDYLRKTFRIDDDSSLKSRDLRNAIEHFDEKLDIYLEAGIAGYIFPEYIGPTHETEGVPFHLFRAYYVDTGNFQLLNNQYEIQPIVKEVGRLHEMLLTMDSSGGFFSRAHG